MANIVALKLLMYAGRLHGQQRRQ